MCCLCVLLCFMCFGFGTKFSGTDGYHTRTRASQTRPQTPATRSKLFLRQFSARSPGRRHSTSRAALAQEKSGRTGRLIPRADAIRRAAAAPPRAAERTRSAASRRCTPRTSRTRSSRAAELRGPLTGVFSAPASGVSERRADPRHRPADLRLQLLLPLLP